MYGKIFESIYDGSLYGNWEAIVTMQQLIVLADADGVVDMTASAIAGKTSIPLEILEKGLKFLSEPDPHSRSSANNGVRIKLLDEQRCWGWFLVNHKKYRDMRTAEDRRIYMRSYMKQYREKESVNSCKQSLTQLANQDTDTDTDTDKNTTSAPSVPGEFEEFKEVYPLRSGSQPWSRALKAIRKRLKEGSDWVEILDGAKRYARYCDASGKTGTEFVLQAATFCGPDKRYLEQWRLPPTKSQIRQDKNIDAAKEWLEDANG